MSNDIVHSPTEQVKKENHNYHFIKTSLQDRKC